MRTLLASQAWLSLSCSMAVSRRASGDDGLVRLPCSMLTRRPDIRPFKWATIYEAGMTYLQRLLYRHVRMDRCLWPHLAEGAVRVEAAPENGLRPFPYSANVRQLQWKHRLWLTLTFASSDLICFISLALRSSRDCQNDHQHLGATGLHGRTDSLIVTGAVEGPLQLLIHFDEASDMVLSRAQGRWSHCGRGVRCLFVFSGWIVSHM